MFNNDEDGALTVYNGVEDRVIPLGDSNGKLLDMCCDVKQCTALEPDNNICPFKTKCSDETKLIHRCLILGEPLTKECLEKMTFAEAHVFNDWDPGVISNLLESITTLMAAVTTDGQFFREKPIGEDADFFKAVLLIRIFVQLNHTGPDFTSEDLTSKLELFEAASKEADKAIKSSLEVEGIELNSSVRAPALLLFAKFFLSSLSRESDLWPFYVIWRFRIDYLHQRSLIRRCWNLSRRLKYYADRYIAWTLRHDIRGTLIDVHASMLCEISEMLIYYCDGILSERFLEEAMKTLGIAVELSGKMGFRTKFQQTPTPQSIVCVKMLNTCTQNESPPIEQDSFLSSLPNCLPKSEALNDDTRLERIRLVDEQTLLPHLSIHQLVLCNIMLYKQGFYGNTELDQKEVEALINVLLDNPLCWSGRISALVTRCKLEKLDKRAIDRTLRQLDGLLKFVSRQEQDTCVPQRHYLFFGSGHPSRADIMMLFGEVLLSLEHWKEALRVYTELGSFEQIVLCFQRMSLRHKAEDLVRDKIKDEGKSPKLLVLLGDVTSDISYYEEAWNLSGGKSYFSQNRLGDHYYKRSEYETAAVHLKRAVQLAPLEYPCWVKLAWACYKIEDLETAFQAYLRAANLEYDNFQVWNNLANCALKLDRKDYALRAYKLAVKCNYDEWRVWSNILVVASELRNFQDAVTAYHRILDLNKSFSDEGVLNILVDIALNEKCDSTTLNNLTKLFGRITSTSSRSFMIWLLYGRLLAAYTRCDSEDCDDTLKETNYERGMHYYDKSLTLMRQNPDWKTDPIKLTNVVNCIIEFRQQRMQGKETLDNELNNRLKGLDIMLKQTAFSVHDNLKTLMEALPNPEKISSVFNEIAEEIKNAFYA